MSYNFSLSSDSSCCLMIMFHSHYLRSAQGCQLAEQSWTGYYKWDACEMPLNRGWAVLCITNRKWSKWHCCIFRFVLQCKYTTVHFCLLIFLFWQTYHGSDNVYQCIMSGDTWYWFVSVLVVQTLINLVMTEMMSSRLSTVCLWYPSFYN